VRARPKRIVIERGGGGVDRQPLRAEIDPANIPQDVAAAISRLLDETRPPAPPDAPLAHDAYDVVLDYGDRSERLRFSEAELPADVRAALDSRLAPGG
jgi:hypothetical protein